MYFFFFNDTATTEIYTLSLHDALPICEYRELFELQAADVIQPDISHIGGLLETKKLAAWADVYYVTVAPHNVGGQINTAAALHLAACTTNFKIQEYFNDFEIGRASCRERV